ncbi:MAG TPA: HEPN domain-containing protein [Pedobacter sp.]|nr:HEPN domain-containing protein [Pedobacter sp.]
MKQELSKEFLTLLEKLIFRFQPLQLFCFHQIGNDLFLLMVTDSVSRIEHTVQDFANAHYRPGRVVILVHGKQSIENSLAAGNGFFKNACQPFNLRYSSGDDLILDLECDAMSSIPELKAGFERRSALTQGFFASAKDCFMRGQYNLSVFLLHQTVEQCCIGLIGLHMDYRCDIHNLYRLLSLCRCFSTEPFDIFLSGDNNDRRLFDVLLKSYCEARYKMNFVVAVEDLRLIFEKVERLVACAKITSVNVVY